LAELDRNRVGLTVAVFWSGLHLLWLLLVALGLAKPLLDLLLRWHMFQAQYSLASFSFSMALMLLVVTFAVGYAFGWLLALVYNKMGGK